MNFAIKKNYLKLCAVILVQALLLLNAQAAYAGPLLLLRNNAEKTTLSSHLNINCQSFQHAFNQLSELNTIPDDLVKKGLPGRASKPAFSGFKTLTTRIIKGIYSGFKSIANLSFRAIVYPAAIILRGVTHPATIEFIDKQISFGINIVRSKPVIAFLVGLAAFIGGPVFIGNIVANLLIFTVVIAIMTNVSLGISSKVNKGAIFTTIFPLGMSFLTALSCYIPGSLLPSVVIEQSSDVSPGLNLISKADAAQLRFTYDITEEVKDPYHQFSFDIKEPSDDGSLAYHFDIRKFPLATQDRASAHVSITKGNTVITPWITWATERADWVEELREDGGYKSASNRPQEGLVINGVKALPFSLFGNKAVFGLGYNLGFLYDEKFDWIFMPGAGFFMPFDLKTENFSIDSGFKMLASGLSAQALVESGQYMMPLEISSGYNLKLTSNSGESEWGLGVNTSYFSDKLFIIPSTNLKVRLPFLELPLEIYAWYRGVIKESNRNWDPDPNKQKDFGWGGSITLFECGWLKIKFNYDHLGVREDWGPNPDGHSLDRDEFTLTFTSPIEGFEILNFVRKDKYKPESRSASDNRKLFEGKIIPLGKKELPFEVTTRGGTVYGPDGKKITVSDTNFANYLTPATGIYGPTSHILVADEKGKIITTMEIGDSPRDYQDRSGIPFGQFGPRDLLSTMKEEIRKPTKKETKAVFSSKGLADFLQEKSKQFLEGEADIRDLAFSQIALHLRGANPILIDKVDNLVDNPAHRIFGKPYELPAGITRNNSLLPVLVNADRQYEYTNNPSQAPVVLTGNNAWVNIIYPLQKNVGNVSFDSDEFKKAMNTAKTLISLQAPNGGIYLAPIGTPYIPYRDISNAQTLVVYIGLNMLLETANRNGYAETTSGKENLQDIHKTMQDIKSYFKNKKNVFNEKENILYAGGKYGDYLKGKFVKDSDYFNKTPDYATDVYLLLILAFGPEMVDEWWGEKTSYELWQTVKAHAGKFTGEKKKILTGLGLVNGNDNAHAETTLDAIDAIELLAGYYSKSHPEWKETLLQDIENLRNGILSLMVLLPDGSYVVREATRKQNTWWGGVLKTEPSVSATARMLMSLEGYNPYELGGQRQMDSKIFNSIQSQKPQQLPVKTLSNISRFFQSSNPVLNIPSLDRITPQPISLNSMVNQAI